jgi:predicted HTH domain antitoxin
LELTAKPFGSEQISLRVAARVAGLSRGEMINEPGRRSIAVVRCALVVLDRQLAQQRGSARR